MTPVSENGAPESGFWDFDDNQESSNQQTVGGRRESIDSARHEQPQFDDRAVEDRLPLLDDVRELDTSNRFHEPEFEEPSEADSQTIDPTIRIHRTELRLTEEAARADLVNYREDVIAPRHPLMSTSEGLLRNVMLDLLLAYLPTTHDEFLSRIPEIYRDQTNQVQISRYLDHVLSILARVDPD